MKKILMALLIVACTVIGLSLGDTTDGRVLQDNFVGGPITTGVVTAANYMGVEDFGDFSIPSYDADGSGPGTLQYAGLQQLDRYSVTGSSLYYDGDNSLNLRGSNVNGAVGQGTVGSYTGSGPLSYLTDFGTNAFGVSSGDYPASTGSTVAMTELQEHARQLSVGTAYVDLDNTGNFIARDGNNVWTQASSIGTPASSGIGYLTGFENNYADSSILSVNTANHEEVDTQNVIGNPQNAPANIGVSVFTQGSTVLGFLDAGKWDSQMSDALNQAGLTASGSQNNWEKLTDYDGHQGTDTQASDFSVAQFNAAQGNPLGYLGVGQTNTFNNDVTSYPGASWFT
jgi:hypothetical protein